MTGKTFHQAIRWFIIIFLIVSVFLGSPYFDYGIVLALIFLILRTTLDYKK